MSLWITCKDILSHRGSRSPASLHPHVGEVYITDYSWLELTQLLKALSSSLLVGPHRVCRTNQFFVRLRWYSLGSKGNTTSVFRNFLPRHWNLSDRVTKSDPCVAVVDLDTPDIHVDSSAFSGLAAICRGETMCLSRPVFGGCPINFLPFFFSLFVFISLGFESPPGVSVT